MLLACSSNSRRNLNYFSADNEAIHYVGRFDFKLKKSPKVWASGAYCSFTFKGKDCEVIILDEQKNLINRNYISVIVDGKKMKRIQLKNPKNRIIVAKNLKNTTHSVLICKDTEAAIGYIQFAGIKCKKLIKKRIRKHLILEFIGDSITCGNGCDTSKKNCGEGTWYDQHNAYSSYGPQLARRCKAEWLLSSVSGIGLTRSCCGTTHTLPDIYDKIDLQPGGENYHFKRQKAKIIFVTLGQNDGLQKASTYILSYVLFLKKLRKIYPKSTIVCCSSPMANTKLKKYHAKVIPLLVKILKNKHFKNIFAFNYRGTYRNGCNFHPSLKDHRKMANELYLFLRKKRLI